MGVQRPAPRRPAGGQLLLQYLDWSMALVPSRLLAEHPGRGRRPHVLHLSEQHDKHRRHAHRSDRRRQPQQREHMERAADVWDRDIHPRGAVRRLRTDLQSGHPIQRHQLGRCDSGERRGLLSHQLRWHPDDIAYYRSRYCRVEFE